MADEPMTRDQLISVMGNLRIMIPVAESGTPEEGSAVIALMGNIPAVATAAAAEPPPDPPEGEAQKA